MEKHRNNFIPSPPVIVTVSVADSWLGGVDIITRLTGLQATLTRWSRTFLPLFLHKKILERLEFGLLFPWSANKTETYLVHNIIRVSLKENLGFWEACIQQTLNTCCQLVNVHLSKQKEFNWKTIMFTGPQVLEIIYTACLNNHVVIYDTNTTCNRVKQVRSPTDRGKVHQTAPKHPLKCVYMIPIQQTFIVYF